MNMHKQIRYKRQEKQDVDVLVYKLENLTGIYINLQKQQQARVGLFEIKLIKGKKIIRKYCLELQRGQAVQRIRLYNNEIKIENRGVLTKPATQNRANRKVDIRIRP